MVGGGWEESRIKLISAEAKAEALLGLAELGNKLGCYSVQLVFRLGDLA